MAYIIAGFFQMLCKCGDRNQSSFPSLSHTHLDPCLFIFYSKIKEQKTNRLSALHLIIGAQRINNTSRRSDVKNAKYFESICKTLFYLFRVVIAPIRDMLPYFFSEEYYGIGGGKMLFYL